MKSKDQKVTFTDKVDRIVTNRFLGIPIFLLLMYFMFMLTFDWLGFPLSDIIGFFYYRPLTSGIESLLAYSGASAFIHDLIIDGIVAGVGGVLVFVPQIFILILFYFIIRGFWLYGSGCTCYGSDYGMRWIKWKGIYSDDHWIWL